MIRKGADAYKADLKNLWKLCFPDDTETFVDFYFDNVYRNDETLILLNENRPVASLQIIPYQLKMGKTVSLAGYLSGIMTHPGFRKKGYMGKLLNAAFEVMKDEKYDYTFLIPQKKELYDLYEKYGYVPAFPKHSAKSYATDIKLFHPVSNKDRPIKIFTGRQAVDFPAFYSVYSRFLEEKANAVLKTESQVLPILFDFFSEDGVLFADSEGIAFTFKEDDTIIIKEFFYRKEEIKAAFLKTIFEYYRLPKTIILNDPSASATENTGMIKKLNASSLLQTDIYMSMMLD
jgi:predicted acetyltransferase